MESGSGKGTEQEMEQINLKKKHKELLKKGGKSLPFEQMDREENELFKKMGSKSGKGTEIESGKDQGELRKEHERLTTEYEILRRELRIEHLEERAVINPGHSGKKQRERDMLRYLERELNKTEIKLGMGTKRDSGKEPEMERDEMKEPEMERDEMKEQSKLSKKQRKLLKQKHKKLMKKRLKERDSGDLLGSFAPTFSGKHQSLVKEIISVERERRDLLASLTPTFSIWKEIDSQATWTIATKEEPVTARGDENQLADYFNLMLQDMEDLGHRMLSMLHFLNKSNDPIRSYKATELCNTATKLNTHISKGFITDQEPWQEPEQINLLSLFRKYSRFPSKYDNTLAQLVMEEDEEKKYEDVEVEEEEQEKDVSTMEYLKERMDVEQQFFAHNRTFWEDVWGSRIGRCGRFMDTTILSPMQFTHNTPGSIPSPAAVTGSTLQIYSIKIKNLKGLNWPLRVYGEVAARDTVDHNRNILFSRSKFNYQELIGEDHSLCLTGPSRAIVALGDVDFEVELQVTNGAQSQTLISCRERYGGTDAFFSSLASVTDGGDGRTFLLSNQSCTAEVTLEQLDRSLQATIVGVRVTKGGWPFKYGCRIVCSWSPFAATEDIPTTYRRLVLLDHRGKGLPRGSENYLQLSRKVVSVESQGTLRVAIEAYGKSRRCIAREGHIDFPVQQCQTRRLDCPVGDATVEVVVAWSLLVKEKVYLSLVDCPM